MLGFFVPHKAKQVLAFQRRLHAIDPNYLRNRPVAGVLGTSTVEFIVCIVFSAATAPFPNLGSIKSICSTQFCLALGSATRVHTGWRPLQSPRSPTACDLGDRVAPGLSVAPPAAAVTPSDPEEHHLQAEEAR